LTIIPTANANIIESKHVAVSIRVIPMAFHRELTNISHRIDEEFEVIGERPYYIQSTTVRLFAEDRQLYTQAELVAAAAEVPS
jgi:hypothetical protein